jgi:hypothetical protein
MFHLDTIRPGCATADGGFPGGQLYQIANRTDRLGCGQVADAPVQVQPELSDKDFVRGAEPVALATFLEQGQVNLVGIAAEDGLGHLDVAIGGDIEPRRG